MGGLTILETSILVEAPAWARRGAKASRMTVELREIFFWPDPPQAAERSLSFTQNLRERDLSTERPRRIEERSRAEQGPSPRRTGGRCAFSTGRSSSWAS